jgi:Tol biopolymer transport system component
LGGHSTNPLWTHDGLRIIFQSDDGGLFWQRADGSSAAERLTTPEKGVSHVADAASPVENVITFTVAAVGGGIWALPLDDRKPKLLIPKAVGFVGGAVFSPDGHWLAYYSNGAGGPPQIYVQPFPLTSPPIPITQTGTNISPLWSLDGKRVFYLRAEGTAGKFSINSVDVQKQPSVEFDKPISLPIQIYDPGSVGRPYDILPNGQFITTLPPDQAQSADLPSSQINTVLNWFSELKKQVPVK